MGKEAWHHEVFVRDVLIVGCSLWTGLGFAGPVAHASAAASVHESYFVQVKLCDGTGLDAPILKTAQEEASKIYRNAGVEVLWQTDCELIMDPKRPDSASIYIVPAIPRPLLIRLQHLGKKQGVLATAFPDAEGRVGPAIYVSRQAVEAHVELYLDGKMTDLIVARALGRVFAHELAHRFLQASHANGGILRESFNHQDLVGEAIPEPFFLRGQLQKLKKIARKVDADRVVASRQ
jgi:hypothetical protein